MKITILALHLGYGGIEKFISNIANMLIEDNEIEIISIYKLYDIPPFYINPKVKITYLIENLKPNREEFYNSIKSFNIKNFFKEAFKSIKILHLKKSKMKKAIKQIKEGVVISTIYAHNKMVSKYCNNLVKKIATEHNYNSENKKYIKKVVNSCKNIDYMVIASKKLSKIYENKMKKCKVVNIPLSLDYIPEKTSNLEEKSITYIGRLSKEKGVIDLIEIFKIINQKDNKVILNIIGDGDQKNNLLLKIKENRLEKSVIMHGFKTRDEIEKILINTGIGINTSFTESFGLAILETFSYGIPCLAFDSAEGAKEIIDNNINGYIVQNRDFEMMAGKILELLDNKQMLQNMGAMARNKSLQYKKDNIKIKWDKIIKL